MSIPCSRTFPLCPDDVYKTPDCATDRPGKADTLKIINCKGVYCQRTRKEEAGPSHSASAGPKEEKGEWEIPERRGTPAGGMAHLLNCTGKLLFNRDCLFIRHDRASRPLAQHQYLAWRVFHHILDSRVYRLQGTMHAHANDVEKGEHDYQEGRLQNQNRL